MAEGYSGAIQEASTRLFEIAPRLISGTTYTSAQAALARALDPAAAGAVTLGQVELLPIRSAGEGLVALPLRVQGEGDLEGLLSLLGTLEAGPVLLHVEDLEMDGRERPLLDSPELASAPETLSFRFTLVGFSLADVPGAADGDAPPEEEGGSSSPRREP